MSESGTLFAQMKPIESKLNFGLWFGVWYDVDIYQLDNMLITRLLLITKPELLSMVFG